MFLYLWPPIQVILTLKYSWIFSLLLWNLPPVHKTLDNQWEAIAGARDVVKIIKFCLSIAVQLLISIQCSSFNQSFFSINSCFFIAWGDLWVEWGRLFKPFYFFLVEGRVKYSMRKKWKYRISHLIANQKSKTFYRWGSELQWKYTHTVQ